MLLFSSKAKPKGQNVRKTNENYTATGKTTSREKIVTASNVFTIGGKKKKMMSDKKRSIYSV